MVLPRRFRMTESADFRRTTRRGVRVARPSLVLHAGRVPLDTSVAGDQLTQTVRVGFVVGKAVGNAVARNRVKRRLRHLIAARVSELPAATSIVVRALPVAATRPDTLPADLAGAWSEALHRLGKHGPASVAP